MYILHTYIFNFLSIPLYLCTRKCYLFATAQGSGSGFCSIAPWCSFPQSFMPSLRERSHLRHCICYDFLSPSSELLYRHKLLREHITHLHTKKLQFTT